MGEPAIRKCFREQLATLKQDGQNCIGSYPVMMGEIGIPFDLDDRKAYTTGDYSNQLRALDASLNACDGKNAFNMTIWCYCPDNTHLDGDQWNGEDLSIWCLDDRTRQSSSSSSTQFRRRTISSDQATSDSSDNEANASSIKPTTPLLAANDISWSSSNPLDLNDGSRAIAAFCRPYPMACVGIIKEFEFDLRSSVFTLEVEVSASNPVDANQPTVIFVPLVHYAATPRSVVQAARDDFSSDEALKHKAKRQKIRHDIFPVKTSASCFAHHARFKKATSHIDQLALEVDVTSGRWEIEGQQLKWYYKKPLAGTTTERISIRRAGGAIPSWGELYGHSSYWTAILGNLVSLFYRFDLYILTLI